MAIPPLAYEAAYTFLPSGLTATAAAPASALPSAQAPFVPSTPVVAFADTQLTCRSLPVADSRANDATALLPAAAT